jgi:hypothetical protein
MDGTLLRSESNTLQGIQHYTVDIRNGAIGQMPSTIAPLKGVVRG